MKAKFVSYPWGYPDLSGTSRYLREVNPPHWMSDKARCQITDQFTLYRQQEASLNAWQACSRPSPQPLPDKVQMQLLATSWNKVKCLKSLFDFRNSSFSHNHMILYIAYSESQDFKHRCQVIDVNKYPFYHKKSEFSLRVGCVLSLFSLCIELIEMVFLMTFLTE